MRGHTNLTFGVLYVQHDRFRYITTLSLPWQQKCETFSNTR